MAQAVGKAAMGVRPTGRTMGMVAVCLCVAIPPPAHAETIDQLDWMSHMTGQVASGLQLARDQSERGELLDALATLERVLALHPEAKEVQLRHASLLCRIDDHDGATAEFSRLKQRDFAKRIWAEAKAPCIASEVR